VSDADKTLHEREREIRESIPNHCHDNEDVLPERILNIGPDGGTLPVVFSDGEFLGPFERGRRKLHKGREGLLGHILPFKVWTTRRGSVKIDRGSKFYFEDEDTKVRVHEATIDSDGEIFLTLRETGFSYPQQSWTFRTIDLAQHIEEERLRHSREINERAEETLAELRGETA